MENKPKKIGILTILSIVMVVLVVSASYAAFSYLKAGTKSNTITTGTLQLTLTEGNQINLTEAYPMTDANGLATTGYSFTLKNTGTAPAVYKIYLDNVTPASGETKLEDSWLRYNLTKNTTVGSASLLTSLGADKNRVLDSGTLNASVTNSYVLRLWIRTDINTNNIEGHVWRGKLRITGDQQQ